MRCGKKIPLTGRASEGRFAKQDFAIISLKWQVVRLVLGTVPLAARRARLLASEMFRMMFCQMCVDCPSKHLPGSMPKLFDLGEGRFPRRPGLAKAVL
jgi:hypothetical protein